jgi:hypothetical protein
MTDSRWRRFLVVLAPAFLAPLQLLLFGPHTIYSANVQEFTAPFWALALELAPVLLAAALVLAAAGAALPERALPYYAAALVAFGIVVWTQGNLMVGDYGVLDGQAIEWADNAWRQKYELALWIAVPLAAVVFARRLVAIAAFASGVVIALQVALLVYTSVQATSDERPSWVRVPEAIFDVSARQNVFHFVLDGFQSDAFEDILEADRAQMDRWFDGSTFFVNHLGAFPTTILSIPAMLTGAVHRNQEPMRQFMTREFRKASLFRVLRARGYQVDVVSGLSYDRGGATNFYRLPAPYVTYDAYTRFAGWQLADLALFRHAPHVLKPWIYNDQSWRLQATLGESEFTAARRYGPVNAQAFLADYTARMRVGAPKPTYKYIHVPTPHWPVSVNAGCEYIGARSLRRPNYTDQARCALRRVGELLDRLRELDLYDSSLVLITSDHGVALPPEGFTGDRDMLGTPLSALAGSALALLVVKPPASTGPVRVSEAPSAISDVPATVADTLGLEHPFGGTSALKLDERADRPRQFATYPWNSSLWEADFFPFMDVFTVAGRPTDGRAWKAEESIYPPGAGHERSRGFYKPERGAPGHTIRWSSPLAFLHAPPGARGFELKVRSSSETPQTITIEMDGVLVGRKTLDSHEWHTLHYTVPPPDGRRAGGWITLRVDPPFRVPRDRRLFGVMTRDLTWIH